MLKGGFFNSMNGDRKYNAQDVTEYFQGLFSSGIVSEPSTSFEVKALASPAMGVQVLAGKAFIDGYWCKNTSAYALDIDSANVALPRIDAIVLRLDLTASGRAFSLQVIKGTAASDPAVPSITRTAYIKDYLLATVYIASGATMIQQTNITDTRSGSDCGYVSSIDNYPVLSVIQRGMYIASGTNDNIRLSSLVQAFYNAGTDFQQLEIDIYGDLDCTDPAATGQDNAVTWFNFGTDTANESSRRVKLNFSHAGRIQLTAKAGVKNVLIDCANRNLEIANLQAAMYSTPNGSIFSGDSAPTVTDSAFWLNGSSTQTLIGAYQGTFINCRMSVTNGTGAAYGFSGNGNTLALNNVEVMAYNASGSANESVGVHVMANQTANILLMTNCKCPVITRSGYKQDNVVKVNSGYYSLMGNVFGKEAALYASGAGKNEIATIYYSGGGKTSGGGGHTVEDANEVVMPQRTNLRFVNAQVTDDPDNDVTIVSGNGQKGDKGDKGDSGGVWGEISGDITDQTDLMQALNDAGQVQTVNNEYPDVNGNVNVDVGVKTVNGQTPDAQGNVDAGGGNLYVTVTNQGQGVYTLDHTFAEILANIQAGGTPVLIYMNSVYRLCYYSTSQVQFLVQTSAGFIVFTITATSVVIRSLNIKPQTTTATISASGWDNNNENTITSGYIKADNVVTLTYPTTISDAEYQALKDADIRIMSQSAGSIGIKADGTVPSIDIPITLLVQG